MQLTVRDAAHLLQVPERTIYEWIRDQRLPNFRVGEHYRFNEVELLEWAMRRKVAVSPDLFGDAATLMRKAPSVGAALAAGAVHYGLPGHDRHSVLEALVERMPVPESDREFLLAVFLSRQQHESSVIGHGIAIPHVRNPLILKVDSPRIYLCFLAQPVDFGAADHQPVSTLFALVSPTIRAHLQLLARLAFLLEKAEFRAILLRRPPRDELLAQIALFEQEKP